MEDYMQKLSVVDKNKNILFSGTKNDCMNFIKVRKYSRDEINIIHHTLPRKEPELEFKPEKPKVKYDLFKRFFKK
jgi:hypothetical protein